jgi:CRP-like cAMP-binding protein
MATRGSRASASEYLDNILTGQVRKRLMPVLEDLPLEERVKRGNMLLKTRPRDLEETLLHLINDDDQVVAAVAIDVVRQTAYGRSATISNTCWRIATFTTGTCSRQHRGRSPSGACLPIVAANSGSSRCPPRKSPAASVRWLLFGSVSVDELFRMASTARQVRHQSGTVLLQEGITPDTIHVLLDGHVVESGTTARPGTINAPSSFGFAQALQGTAMRKTVRTADTAVTLALTVDELNTLLAGQHGSGARVLRDLGQASRGFHRQQSAVNRSNDRTARTRSRRPAASRKRFLRCSACLSFHESRQTKWRRSRPPPRPS